MQRVHYLIEKLSELSKSQRTLTAIDLDLMLDYTRVMYADLLEERKQAGFKNIQPESAPQNQPQEETEAKPADEIIQQPVSPGQSFNDLRTVIGINDKYLYISELFNGDKAAYEQAIKSLSNINVEDEAINWIKKELHNNNNWNAEDETVKSFYNLVSSSFS